MSKERSSFGHRSKAPGLRAQSPLGGLLLASSCPRPSHTLQPPRACPCTHPPSCFRQAVSMSWMSQCFIVLKPSSHAAPGGLYLHSASQALRPSRAVGSTAPASQGATSPDGAWPAVAQSHRFLPSSCLSLERAAPLTWVGRGWWGV